MIGEVTRQEGAGQPDTSVAVLPTCAAVRTTALGLKLILLHMDGMCLSNKVQVSLNNWKRGVAQGVRSALLPHRNVRHNAGTIWYALT